MKPLRQQFIDALGYRGKTPAHYWDFTLTVIAGIAVFFGEVAAMEVRSGGSAFDLKVAIGCFVLAAACVLLAVRRLFVLGCTVMVPAALLSWNLAVTGDRKVRTFYLVHMAAGFAVLVVGGLAKLLWQRLRVRRTR